jgi:methionyl-tRNA synthetase
VDTFRWYLCKEAPYGGELSFSEDSLIDMHNADLCDTLGNLVHRATNLCEKYCDGEIMDVPTSSPINFNEVLDMFETKMNNFELQGGASIAIQGFRDLNGYLTEEAPWLKKGDEFTEFRQSVVRTTLESIYILSHLLIPFIPEGAAKIFRKLNTEPVTLINLNRGGRNLAVGTKVEIGDVLYSKVRVSCIRAGADT